MTGSSRGLVSELLLVRMHGRAGAYLRASEAERRAIALACRREATVPDLAQRILSRTIYAQTASRAAPIRELLQNALDASPRGARIDVRSAGDGAEIHVTDRGRGMTREELLEDLLVPFRSGKEGAPDAIGEHGIGFFSALEIAPRVEVVTVTAAGGHRLEIAPVGGGPPFADFAWTLAPLEPARGAPTGTSVRLSLSRALPRALLVSEIAAAVGFVDPVEARIYVDGQLVNTVRTRMRRVARVPIPGPFGGPPLGDLELYLGRGEAIEPQFSIVQKGLTVAGRVDPFPGPDLSLHRDLARAITAAGFGIVAELPLGVPLNKGRSAVAAPAAAAVEGALLAAFERFLLRDALFDRELLRAVDHRLSSVLDRLLGAALLGESAEIPAAEAVDELAPTARRGPASMRPPAAPPRPEPAPPAHRAPTVAAPEEVVRFARSLLDAPLFRCTTFDAALRPDRRETTLRELLQAHRAGVLRRLDDAPAPGLLHLSLEEPLSQAFWRRLAAEAAALPPAAAPAELRRARTAAPGPVPMPRTTRETLIASAASLPGVRAVLAAMAILERIDAAISQSADLPPSPIWVHQDLYGPDEMAHTDGTGISVNLASQRLRALISAVLVRDDPVAFSALVDLLLHEKTHVSLASYVPRPTAEHGASFYRRKEWLRRRMIHAIGTGAIADPMRWLPLARRGLCGAELPAPELLSQRFQAAA